MRHIKEIKNLPISELTDEEIVKAAMHRLQAHQCALVYYNGEGSFFLCQYKTGAGKRFWQNLIFAWEGKFGKMRKIDYNKTEE